MSCRARASHTSGRVVMSLKPVPMTISSPVVGDRDRPVERVGAEERVHQGRAVLRSADERPRPAGCPPRATARSVLGLEGEDDVGRRRRAGRSWSAGVAGAAPSSDDRRERDGSQRHAAVDRGHRMRSDGTLSSRSRSGGSGRSDEHDAGHGGERGEPDLVVVPVAGDQRGPRRRRRGCHDVEHDAGAPHGDDRHAAARARRTIQPMPSTMSASRPQSTPGSGGVHRRPRRGRSTPRPGPSTRRTASRRGGRTRRGATSRPPTPATATAPRSRATFHQSSARAARRAPAPSRTRRGRRRRGRRGSWAG